MIPPNNFAHSLAHSKHQVSTQAVGAYLDAVVMLDPIKFSYIIGYKNKLINNVILTINIDYPWISHT
jgi:hypothetical protein